ncbi:MAG: Chemotaxis response regulator protein-glutamate methylesterase of group 1 operon [Planctomycetota bacterium]|jgi:two-component system chemotaxis response regulator CheB
MRTLQVLIVDDSALFRTLLQNVIRELPGASVCGSVSNGEQALDAIARLAPDVVTLDVEMPGLSGIDVLRELRRRKATCRVIMVSRLTAAGARITTDALLEGAFDFILKPSGAALQNNRQILSEALAEHLTSIRQMLPGETPEPGVGAVRPPVLHQPALASDQPPGVIVIGCSTGGPDALARLIPDLPIDWQIPIVIVQHMPAGFTHSLAQRLNEASELQVSEAADGDLLTPGRVFVAKGGTQLKLIGDAANKVVLQLTEDPPENFCRPAVDYTLRSAAAVFGNRTIALILTGMGQDGAAGCRAVHEAGGRVLAQHPEGCTVYGMPRAAMRTGTVSEELRLSEIVARLTTLTSTGRRKER